MPHRVTLTREEFESLRETYRWSPDHPGKQTINYPTNADGAAAEARTRGAACPNGEAVNNLIRRGRIELPDNSRGASKYTPELIDHLVDYYEERRDFLNVAKVCDIYGVSYFQWLTALAQAHDECMDDCLRRYGRAAISVLTDKPSEEKFTAHLEMACYGEPQVSFTLSESTIEEMARRSAS